MASALTNEDVMKATLTGVQMCDLITEYMCMACTVGGGRRCRQKDFDIECAVGYQKWLQSEPNEDNWRNIKAVFGIKDAEVSEEVSHERIESV